MIKLEMKNYNMILKEKQEIYQHYYKICKKNMNFLQAKKFNLIKKD